MIFGELCQEFREWSPTHAKMVVEYKPWGSNSILVRLSSGLAYKAKRIGPNEFVMQSVSEDDIKMKFKGHIIASSY